MPASLDDFGVTSITTALTKQFRLRKTTQDGDVVLTTVGVFAHACAYGEEYMFDAEGAGDLPVDFGLGGSGPTISGLTGGVTIIDGASERQSTGSPNEWTGSGEHAPDAVPAA